MEKKPTKLSEIFRYKPLKKYEGLLGKLPCRAGTTFVGVEIELERVLMDERGFLPSSFHLENDGSLRNHGKEFITVPIRLQFLEKELERAFSGIKSYTISGRCSVHVHLNVRDMTEEELFKFILLYLVFEKSLYRLSGNRWDNLFCIPLYNFYEDVGRTLSVLDNKNKGGIEAVNWNKYSGLNLCPIWGGEGREGGGKGKTGTAEFRQMEGTVDIERIINWINLIVSLKISAKTLKKEDLISKIETMNSTSEYYFLSDFVFKDWSHMIKEQKTFKEDVESCITRTKAALYLQKFPFKSVGMSEINIK